MSHFSRGLPIFLLALGFPFAGYAETPAMKMHRVQAQTKDASGWFLGASTEGSFSVLLPIPFNDFTVTARDPKLGEVKTFIIGSKSVEGLKFSATETPRTAGMKEPDLQGLPGTLKKPGQTVSGVDHIAFHGMPAVALELTDGKSGAFIRYVRTPHSLLALILEYPEGQRGLAAELQGRFIGSLKIKEPPPE